MLSKAQLIQLITRNDEVSQRAIGRALVHLLNRQTEVESTQNRTIEHNNRGFTSSDARQGSIHAKYWLKHGQLLEWQIKYWLKPNRRGTPRLAKYWRQLAEEAKKKQLRAAAK